MNQKKKQESNKLFIQAKKVMPGGVNSPVRAFKAVETNPYFIKKAKGSYIWTSDKKKFIDYLNSWGAIILGHAYSKIIKGINKSCKKGTSFGAPTIVETELAELIIKLIPSIEMIRMVNSGTEATMSAIRLARAYTNKDKIIKFEGCYHGHSDSFLIQAGSSVLDLVSPNSKGITQNILQNTLIAHFNDIESVKILLKNNKNKIAALILEPICGNIGCIIPEKNFLKKIRELCSNEKIILIFDEVITGFRIALGGAQEIYKINPDITCLGKIIGGGFPVGAFGGRKKIMEHLAPLGEVYQAGTLSGNPIAMTAGLNTIKELIKLKVHDKLENLGKKLEEGINYNLKQLKLNYKFNRIGSMFSLFFTDKFVNNFKIAKASQTKLFSLYFKEMLNEGIYLSPSPFETSFLSLSHTDKIIKKTIQANYQALKKIMK